MDSSIFCPFCQRKNSADAKQCVYCGVQFVLDRPEPLTTKQVAEMGSAILGQQSRCAEYLLDLPQDGLALFVMNEETPIILDHVNQVIIGRQSPGSSVPVVDLTRFGGVEMGVSRQHAQITLMDGIYSLIDLGSTNGSWLNRHRLIPGKPYRLRSNDQIGLGQLRLTACFHSSESSEQGLFALSDPTFPDSAQSPFTLGYLTTTVLPYVKAIVEIQQALEECQGHAPQDIHLNGINLLHQAGTAIVSLDGGAGAVRIVEKWIRSRRKRIAESPEDAPDLQTELNQLAAQILAEAAPDADETTLTSFRSRLASPLSVVMTSNLVLSTEALSRPSQLPDQTD